MQDMEFLTMALRDALEQYSAERPAILRGFQILLNDQVSGPVEGLYRVESQRTPGEYYQVTVHKCTCRAASFAHGGRCLHRYAVAMHRQAGEYAWADAQAKMSPPRSLAAEICDPTRRVARELAGFPGPTARHM